MTIHCLIFPGWLSLIWQVKFKLMSNIAYILALQHICIHLCAYCRCFAQGGWHYPPDPLHQLPGRQASLCLGRTGRILIFFKVFFFLIILLFEITSKRKLRQKKKKTIASLKDLTQTVQEWAKDNIAKCSEKLESRKRPNAHENESSGYK